MKSVHLAITFDQREAAQKALLRMAYLRSHLRTTLNDERISIFGDVPLQELEEAKGELAYLIYNQMLNAQFFQARLNVLQRIFGA